MFDSLSILNGHSSISGFSREIVELDNLHRLNKALDFSQNLYMQHLMDEVEKMTSIKLITLENCQNGMRAANETVLQCPISSHSNNKEFLVVVANP